MLRRLLSSSGKPFTRERYGYLFGLKPGEKVKLTAVDYRRISAMLVLASAVYLYQYWPRDEYLTWCKKVALKRMLERGIDVSPIFPELSAEFGMDVNRLIGLWAEFDRSGPTQSAASYVIEYPRAEEPNDWILSVYLRYLPRWLTSKFIF